MKAEGRRRRRRRLPRQLKTTREGKLLIAITLGLGFGAINSGNNLLYLILGMLLSLIVLSGVLMIIGVQVMITAMLADIVSANRKLTEEALVKLRRLEAATQALPADAGVRSLNPRTQALPKPAAAEDSDDNEPATVPSDDGGEDTP